MESQGKLSGKRARGAQAKRSPRKRGRFDEAGQGSGRRWVVGFPASRSFQLDTQGAVHQAAKDAFR